MNLQLIFGRMLLLYQIPKAGSQTIEATLRGSSFPQRILRFHFLSGKNAKEIRRCIREHENNESWNLEAIEQLKLLVTLSRALRIRRLLLACGARIPQLQVITATREVIGAGLSSIFENYRLFVPQLQLLTAQKCREVLNRPKFCPQFQHWFDVELKTHVGIDVYAQPFPWGAGYSIYENRLARVLLYRFELLPRLAPVLGEFLGIQLDTLVSRNLSESKEYAQTYQQVKSTLRLPAQFVEEQLSSKLMRHFYSPEQRASLQRKWSGAQEGFG